MAGLHRKACSKKRMKYKSNNNFIFVKLKQSITQEVGRRRFWGSVSIARQLSKARWHLNQHHR
jgi:hypothetical protein